MLYDNVNDTFKWDWSGGGAGSLVEKSTEEVYEGDFACKLTTGWSIINLEFWVEAYRSFNLPALGMSQLDIVWRLKTSVDIDQIVFLWGFDFADWAVAAWVRYLPPGNRWQFRNPDGDWRGFPGASENLAQDCWHRLRLELDTRKKVFGVCSSNAQVWNLDGCVPYNTDWGSRVKGDLFVSMFGGRRLFVPWPKPHYVYFPTYGYLDSVAIRRV